MFKHLLICTLFSFSAFAQQQKPTSQKNSKADSQKIIQVKFANINWNKSAEKIDTGVVVLRDSKSNKTVQILLEETAPDSAVFSGTYWVNWGKASRVMPEVYIIDETQLIPESSLKKVIQSIAEGKIIKKPLFYRKNEYGVQILEVFDTKEESKEAITLLRSQIVKPGVDSTTASKTFGTSSVIMDLKELAEMALSNKARKKEIQKRIVDRYRLEKTDLQKHQNAVDLFKKMPPPMQEKRRQDAEHINAEALDFFKTNSFKQAAVLFQKAAASDPTNISYYFQNAISLYKDKQFNEAIVAFGVSKNVEGFSKESRYYQGICHYEFKEYELAIQVFEEIEATKDKKYAGLAVFYKGLTYFDQKEYDQAKTQFADVLNISTDPKLDEKAEKYMENIEQLIAFSKLKAQKFFVSATAGLLYDSNVLLTADSTPDQGDASNLSDIRYLVGLGLYWRPVFEKTHDFGLKFRTDYIYTKKDSLSKFDPWSWQLSAPYSYKTTLFNRSYKLDIKPGYELLHLGQNEASGSGKPKKLLDAYFLEWGNTFVMSAAWISTYTLIYRKDNFSYDSTKDATKYTLKWSNIYFIDDSKKKGFIADVAYVLNNALTDDSDYKRYEASLLYLTPLNVYDLTMLGGLSAYYLNYNHKTSPQEDRSKTFNLTFSKLIWENISGSLVSTYIFNSSNVDSSKYDKWTLGLVLNGEWGL